MSSRSGAAVVVVVVVAEKQQTQHIHKEQAQIMHGRVGSIVSDMTTYIRRAKSKCRPHEL